MLRNGAIARVKELIAQAEAVGSVRLFSVRHEFPSEWAKFKSMKLEGTTTAADLTLNLREEHYPFWSKGLLETVERVDLFAKPSKDTEATVTVSNKLTDIPVGTRKEDGMVTDPSLGSLRVGKLAKIPRPKPIGKFTLYFSDNTMEDLWLALAWRK